MSDIIAHTEHKVKYYYLHFLCNSSVRKEWQEAELPLPNAMYSWNTGAVSLIWLIDGYFHTKKNRQYLNDIIARLFLTLDIKERLLFESREELTHHHAYKLKDFQNAKSLTSKTKWQGNTDLIGKDKIFWAIKIYTEQKIQEQGEHNEVAYSILESFAFNLFEDEAKDKSTLRAKCRSIWNWYNQRNWTLTKMLQYEKKYTKEELMATRAEQAKKMHTKLRQESDRKVMTLLTGMFAHEYKKKDESWNIAKIARDLKINKRTVMRVLNEKKATL